MKIQRFFAVVLFILTLPFLLVFLLIIRIESKGNPIFTQKRVGRGGKIFVIYKLRTMRLGVEPVHICNSKELEIHEDYRVTNFGRFLRKTHLDEVPQLWNVFIGDMVFVGPRPLPLFLCKNREYYAPVNDNIIPGITGISQMYCLDKYCGYDTSKLDKLYCKKKNVLLDLSICYTTVSKILFNKNTYI